MEDEISNVTEDVESTEAPTPIETGVGNEDTEVLSPEGAAINLLMDILINNGGMVPDQARKVKKVLK